MDVCDYFRHYPLAPLEENYLGAVRTCLSQTRHPMHYKLRNNNELFLYAIQMAARTAATRPDAMGRQIHRVGEFFLRGFMDWYFDPLTRNQHLVVLQPRPIDLALKGVESWAQETWRKINWRGSFSTQTFRRHLLGSDNVTDAMVTNLERNSDGLGVNQWQDSTFGQRGNLHLGTLYVPRSVTMRGKVVQLGWEIICDWLQPVDDNHGLPLQTIIMIFNKAVTRHDTDRRFRPQVRDRTSSVAIRSGNQLYRLVYDGRINDWRLTTCFKIAAASPDEYVID